MTHNLQQERKVNKCAQEWTRTRTVFEGVVSKDDWIVRRDGIDIGRVHRIHAQNGGLPWKWATWTYPAHSGTSESLDEAVEMVRKCAGELPLAGSDWRDGLARRGR